MILRNFQRENVCKDIVDWIADGDAPLLSGSNQRDLSILTKEN